MSDQWTTLASDESLKKTVSALEAHGSKVDVVENGAEAKRVVLEILPEGAHVFDTTSETLAATGIAQEIRDSGKFKAAHREIYALDHNTQEDEIRRRRSTPDWVVGSVHAVTEDGSLMIASGTGSQLASYAYGAAHVVYVVGTQKIVKDIDAGIKRIYEHSLVLEGERMGRVYGVKGSNVNKILIVNSEGRAHGRAQVVLIKEVLGY
jgi:L-lactate utilization protein LutC